MASGMTDKIKGAFSKTKGQLKEQAGNSSGDPALQQEGKFEKSKAKVQSRLGRLKRKNNHDSS